MHIQNFLIQSLNVQTRSKHKYMEIHNRPEKASKTVGRALVSTDPLASIPGPVGGREK